MSSLQGRCGFGNDLQGALVAQTTGTSQHLGQRVPRDVLHHQISDAPAGFVVFLTEVEDRDDVGVTDRGGSLGLGTEPQPGHLVLRVTSQQHLQGDAATKCQVRSEEHTSELQSLMRISYAVFCLTNKNSTTCYT